MTNEQKLAKVKRVITSVLNSPNHSTERAALWFRLHCLREKLKNSIINQQVIAQANQVLKG